MNFDELVDGLFELLDSQWNHQVILLLAEQLGEPGLHIDELISVENNVLNFTQNHIQFHQLRVCIFRHPVDLCFFLRANPHFWKLVLCL